MKKVSVLDVPVDFHCPECGEHPTVTVHSVCEVGAPFCTSCDMDMEIYNYQLPVFIHEGEG